MDSPAKHVKRKVARWERGGAHRVPLFIERWSPGRFAAVSVLSLALAGVATWAWLPAVALFAPIGLFVLIGVRDVFQTRHTILRNYPVIGHLRYLAESMRPEFRQYFVESDQEAHPFSREKRGIVYQRAKDMLDTLPFGTRRSVYRVGYEWLSHSLAPAEPDRSNTRVRIGDGRCDQPYEASILNISAMSYGSLSGRAIEALNRGAAAGGFYHNTGEGGISPYHLHGGDLVWQIGTGYFGARARDGSFDREQFCDNAARETVKMIELKLSQGAKPAHGGILPGDKVTEEIAAIRGVPVGETVESPPAHTAFSGPTGLLEFVTELRELSGGKPVGFKLCLGHPVEFLAVAKAMLETELFPDFITVDGAEGGTGAAPLEFSNSVGMPLDEGLSLVHNALRGAGLRDQVKIISAGKITTGFHVVRQLALGADLCNSARAMMFSLGCIQALKCNTNHCPTGVTTHDPRLVRGLVVADKAPRVANYHEKTIESVLDLLGAAGLDSPDGLRPHHIFRRVSNTEVIHLGDIYPELERGCLLDGTAPDRYRFFWDAARADRFEPVLASRTPERAGASSEPVG